MSATLAGPLAAGAADGHEQLALSAAGGDLESFSELVRRHTGPLHRFLVSTGTDAHEADDVIQEAFVRAYRALGSYDPRFAFTTWLYTIAHRVRLNRQRAARRSRGHLALGSIPEPTAPDDEAPTVIVPSRLWELVRTVLPERQAQALWLRYGEDLELGAIATILDTTSLNVRVMLHRARARLQRHLRAAGFDLEETAP